MEEIIKKQKNEAAMSAKDSINLLTTRIGYCLDSYDFDGIVRLIGSINAECIKGIEAISILKTLDTLESRKESK